ncbi:26S proteasome non-ATPase regulatory subunit 10-like [Argonauta hians]
MESRHTVMVAKVHALLYDGQYKEFMRILNSMSKADRKFYTSVRYNGLTPLFYAAATNNVDIIEFLAQHCNCWVDQRCCYYRCERVTPLWAAVVTNSYNAAFTLLNLGANINGRGWWQSTPLIKALVDENYKMSLLLLSRGARTGVCNVERKTPLMAATFDEELTHGILASGDCAKYQLDIHGNTALHYALKRRQWDIGEVLTQAGISPKVPNNRGVDCHTIIREEIKKLLQIPTTCRRLELVPSEERQSELYRDTDHYYYDPKEHYSEELDVYQPWDIVTSQEELPGFGDDLEELYYRR